MKYWIPIAGFIIAALEHRRAVKETGSRLSDASTAAFNREWEALTIFYGWVVLAMAAVIAWSVLA